MASDPRFEAVKALIENGRITRFRDIFEIVPKSVVAEGMGHSYASFAAKMDNPKRFTIGNVVDMAALFDCAREGMFRLIEAEV